MPTCDNNYGVSRWIVDPIPGQGTHTTIASAIASASSGQTIFIRTGTYTENITLKGGVNLTAFGSDGLTTSLVGTPDANVTIVGTVTASFSGCVNINGIQLKTNGASAFVTSGSNLGQVFFNDCSIWAFDSTGFTLNSSTMFVTFYTCYFISTGSNQHFNSIVGPVDFEWGVFVGTASTAASTTANSNLLFNACDMLGLKITTSLTGGVTVVACHWQFGGETLLTTAGTGTSVIVNSYLASTSASTISIGSGTTVEVLNSEIYSSNTNAITGAGTLKFGGVYFPSTSSTVNTSTQTPMPTNGIKFGSGSLLNVYQQGTFTPELRFGGGNTGMTGSFTGQYTQIGNVVYVYVRISLTAKGSSTGTATVANLPVSTTLTNQGCPVDFFSNVTFSGAYSSMSSYVGIAGTALTLAQCGTGLAAGNMNDTMFANNSSIVLNGFYFIA